MSWREEPPTPLDTADLMGHSRKSSGRQISRRFESLASAAPAIALLWP